MLLLICLKLTASKLMFGGFFLNRKILCRIRFSSQIEKIPLKYLPTWNTLKTDRTVSYYVCLIKREYFYDCFFCSKFTWAECRGWNLKAFPVEKFADITVSVHYVRCPTSPSHHHELSSSSSSDRLGELIGNTTEIGSYSTWFCLWCP